jgi:hypothetical protein
MQCQLAYLMYIETFAQSRRQDKMAKISLLLVAKLSSS